MISLRDLTGLFVLLFLLASVNMWAGLLAG